MHKTLLLAALLAAAGMSSAPALAHGGGYGHGNSAPVVYTDKGAVRGLVKDGVNEYLGIPYAAPPVGNLRWRPPQPAHRWRGVRDATEYANTCPQVTGLGAFAGPNSITEDCLYLNVFTTGSGHGHHHHHGGGKPVIVWIHGGGNFDGSTNGYDATRLAKGGPYGTETVVVTLNYRLGLLGFFSHPAINTEGHLWGNYGILDQQAVLRWVQRNIRAFGGDPSRVALGGQSAGAVDTGANQLSPLAAGLFNRAIYQSAPGFFSTLTSAATAESGGTAFAAAAGCPGTGSSAAACLRALSTQRVLQLQGTPNANGPYVKGFFVDGTVIPTTPQQGFSTGQFNQMPILGGRVRDEGNFGISIREYFSGPPQAPLTEQEYQDTVNASFGSNASLVLGEYPSSNYGGDPQLAYNRVSTDPAACRGLHVEKLWAQYVPVYAYEFNYQSPPYYFPKMPGFQPLAYHTADIQFVFKNWHGGQLGVNLDPNTGVPRELNAAERHLSDQIIGAWTNFADTGNPNGSGNSPWPQFTTSSETYLSQNLTLSTLSSSDYRTIYHCDFWDPMLSY
jgi:para-nitrobenzyl esterase